MGNKGKVAMAKGHFLFPLLKVDDAEQNVEFNRIASIPLWRKPFLLLTVPFFFKILTIKILVSLEFINSHFKKESQNCQRTQWE